MATLEQQLAKVKEQWLATQDQQERDRLHREANRLRDMGANELIANQLAYGSQQLGTQMTSLYSGTYGAAPSLPTTGLAQRQPTPSVPTATPQTRAQTPAPVSTPAPAAAPQQTIDWNAWASSGAVPTGTTIDPAYGLAVAKQRYEQAAARGDAAGMAMAAQAGQYFRSLNPSLDPGNTMTAAQFSQTYMPATSATASQQAGWQEYVPPTFSTETPWDQQIADYIRRIEQAMARGDVTAAEIMNTPEFKQLQEAQRVLLEGATRQTKARLAATGMLGPGSSVAAAQIARVQQEAAAALAAKIPELIDRERRQRLQNIENLQAQLRNLQAMRQDELATRRADFERQMAEREFALREGQVMGQYMPAQLRSLYDQVLQAKENYLRYQQEGRMDLAAAENQRAEAARRQIAALGGDPDAVGAGVSLEQAARNIGQLYQPTRSAMEFDLEFTRRQQQDQQRLAMQQEQMRRAEAEAARQMEAEAKQSEINRRFINDFKKMAQTFASEPDPEAAAGLWAMNEQHRLGGAVSPQAVQSALDWLLFWLLVNHPEKVREDSTGAGDYWQ